MSGCSSERDRASASLTPKAGRGQGTVLVVEDAKTASLVIVARELKDRTDKIAALQEVLEELQHGH